MEQLEVLITKTKNEESIESNSFKDDAYGNASFFSKLSFSWAFKIVKLSSITQIKNEHLGRLEGENKVSFFSEKFNEIWFKHRYFEIKNYPLFKTLIVANKEIFFEAIFFIVLSLIFQVSEVFLLKSYIQVYENPVRNYTYELKLALTFIIIKFVGIFLQKRVTFLQNFLSDRPLIQLNNLIIQKVLKESPSNSKHKYSQGELINLISSDADKVKLLFRNLPSTVFVPFKIIVYVVILFKYMGMSFIFAFIVIILIIFGNLFLQRIRRKTERELNKAKDARMKVTTELLNHLKFAKLFAWETEFTERIFNARSKDIALMKMRMFIFNFTTTLIHSSPQLISMAAIGAYYWMDGFVRLSNIFLILNIFTYLQEPIMMLPNMSAYFFEVIYGLERIEKFMKQDEIEDSNVISNDSNSIRNDEAIKIINGNFSWGKEITDGKKQVKINEENHSLILKNINLKIKKGQLIMVIGEVGSGKSSLMQAILNNMMIINKNEDKKTKIYINGSVSYVAQNSWIRNTTLRDNITFFNSFEKEKYEKIVTKSELVHDIKVLPGGDLTEIGEKGINLSGGQKARVSIARALYSESDIYLFDDPISALDAYVGEKIMKNCILEHLNGKTRVLITHAIQYLHNADSIIVMKNGEIHWEGNFNDLKNQEFYQEYVKNIKKKENDENKGKVEEHSHDSSKVLVTRITKNEFDEKMGKNYYTKYFNYYGGVLFIMLSCSTFLVWQSSVTASEVWLTLWTKWQEIKDYPFYLIYIALNVIVMSFIWIKQAVISCGVLRASRIIHEKMILSLVHAPINTYHDVVPKGQILSRLSKDLKEMDMVLVWDLGLLPMKFLKILAAIIICSIFIYYSLIFVPIIIYIAYKLSGFYNKANKEITSIDRVNRSPIMNIFNETVSGAMTIRAFKSQRHFLNLYSEKLEALYKSTIFKNGISQWFSLSIDYINVFFFGVLILFTLTFSASLGLAAQGVALILNSTISLQTSIMEFLERYSNLESNMVSVERCLKLIEIPSEAAYHTDLDKTLKNWPEKGDVVFNNYSVRYRPETPLVLKNLTFNIKAGEKIGVVGRTGSGKSTLCLSLLRILEGESGNISIDGVDISKIGLNLLRSSITIIPQDPIMFEGTLRYNIDPLHAHSNAEINESLKKVGLSNFAESEKGLNMMIQENGANVSVGERQLISLARAILRKSKIVILDEATANIDFKTEELIQSSIRTSFLGSTLITIAHRIQTIIDYDRILLLGDGMLLEFETPQKLISDKSSYFYQLYSKSV